MKVVVQRVKEASCKVDNKLTGKIEQGLMLLVGFTEGDNEETITKMVQKIVNLRIFDDASGIMNLSVLDIKGSILSISQFTLYADTKKGNRPSYIHALGGAEAIKLYEQFNYEMNKYCSTKPGVFGADMELTITNDGPVTIILEL